MSRETGKTSRWALYKRGNASRKGKKIAHWKTDGRKRLAGRSTDV